ncbi:hypothetical protein N7541_006568 [Penicillium brevicompactum]|uniref:SRR1-like domain-containing protein n=1 Tax=Penicillium brevicompactum TaxID=5074 RepID=A0A9W9R877_PENBR|nr:hypothetical protein N7541_006568 [Penicillium brevicompactum]
MPHSSRPKRPINPKRTSVTDTDGWTHVTNGSNVRRAMRQKTQPEPTLVPAEAPGRLTLSDLQTQFSAHRERWESSESWAKVAGVLRERLEQRPARAVDAIVCIGLGSPSGFLRDGWVDRRAVSLYQLAALVCIKDQVEATSTSPFKIYAQDPVFNTLDESLLAGLDITVLSHPEGFSHITQDSMLFCPGAERQHLELLLPSKPWLLFGGPLEHADAGGVLQSYVRDTDSYCVPPFEALEHAFWNMRLYWTGEKGEE